ncbi:MAG: 2-amino-4-hydroxy-6-hydroxymethyldihydropteridine diphosphokinase [Clostridia bacterium]|nr:2-amino-4-hydroxy-6-hydroxymethyldihydropteridine diphosphokinase [Clostridia bacterium]
MDKIIIKELEVFAHHGVFETEKRNGQNFYVSAKLLVDTRKAGKTDDLNASVNYGEVAHLITRVMQENTWNLIETVAENVTHAILMAFPLVSQVTLTVSKPSAPIGLPFKTVAVTITRGWHKAYIALGSNMGDKKQYIDDAVKALDDDENIEVLKVSSLIETEPYGGVEQDSFLNGALLLKTTLEPDELLSKLHEIESEAGRERLVHWGPRTLDLDILFYDNEVIDTEELHIPHIDMQNRDFVLKPMMELAPWLRHPVLNLTIEQLYKQLTENS